MIETPKISVIMSVYNGERWLKNSIESILSQSLKELEFIIINDGSNDNSKEIIDYYAKEDKRINLISKENTGLADSLNVGIRMARSPWIARIDCDDIAHSSRLEVQYQLALQLGNSSIIGSSCYLINNYGERIGHYNYSTKHIFLENDLRNGRAFFPHSSALFSASSFKIVGGYRSHFKSCQDYDLWLRFLSKGYKFTTTKRKLVSIRKHLEQVSLVDEGFNSLVDSTCALSCYYIREKVKYDPADRFNVIDYNNSFRSNVINVLEGAHSIIRFKGSSYKLNLHKHRLFVFLPLLILGFLFDKLKSKISSIYGVHLSKRVARIYSASITSNKKE